MNKQAAVEDAISIAAHAHKGQKDKAGAPYLLHPLRMMLRMDSEAAMMAAVLHDVVEDTDWTLGRLREEGFSDEVLEARRAAWTPPTPNYTSGVLAKFAKLVSQADHGAVTNILI